MCLSRATDLLQRADSLANLRMQREGFVPDPAQVAEILKMSSLISDAKLCTQLGTSRSGDEAAALRVACSRMDAQIAVNRSVTARVHRLPLELIVEIFLYLPSHTNPSDGLIELDRTVARVCFRWRQVALSTPMLWTCIDVQSNKDVPQRLRYLRRYLPRSRDFPLHVSCQIGPQSTFFPMLSAHASRWQTLTLRTRSADLRTAAPIATPLLERASFNIDDVLGAADAGLLRFLQHTPRLQELSVTCHGLNAHIGLSLPSCPLLVSLHLAFESPYFIAPFLKSIQQYRASLKILRLRSFSIRDDVGDPSSTAPVEFPALNILCASGGGLKLLPLISTPNLHTLVVEFPPPDFPTLILNFLSRQPLNLRILELSQSHDRTWDAMTTATLLACMAHIDGLEELRFKYASVMDDFLTALIWRAEVDYRSCILPKTGLRVSHNYLPNLQVIMYDRTAPPSDILAELCRSRRMSTVSRGWDLIALVEGRKLDTVAGRYWTHSMWS